jgi:peptide/nickel transport system permease protein
LGLARGFLTRMLKTRGSALGFIILLAVGVTALLAPWIAPFSPTAVDANALLLGPSRMHPLGTDALGRDTLSQVVWGARASLAVGLVSVGIALILGVPAGLLAGYLGGWVDNVVMRTVNAIWTFPTIILALAIGTALGPGITTSFIAVGLVFAPVITSIVRARTLSVRESDYVLAARACGAGPGRLIRRHVWPNVLGAVIIQASVLIAAAITTEASLSFLGVGVLPPTPAWGSMLRTGYQYLLSTVWPSVSPGLAIFVTVLGFNLVGDGLARALDPTLRRTEQT